MLAAERARELLAGPTLEAARRLLGAHLVRAPDAGSEARIARIVEVEAYIGMDDRASHARFGRTARNAVMFGPPAVAYVYLVYGMHHCLNVVTEPDGRAAAVLIRAAEPVAGEAAMRAARAAATASRRSPRLLSGPGVLCAALSVTRADSGVDLLSPASPLRLDLMAEPLPDDRIAATPRIGIDYAAEPWRSRPWRFIDRASEAVSGRRNTS